MTFLLYVEFDASSTLTAESMLKNLGNMADIVYRNHPDVYTYVFRHSNEEENKLIFTEIYANEQAFLEHSRHAEFTRLYVKTFNDASGKSRKELCIKDDINRSMSSMTTNILDNYLHVTYVAIQQGFLHQSPTLPIDETLLVLCTDCDERVYERMNSLTHCTTCVSFMESDDKRRLIAVIVRIPDQKMKTETVKLSISTMNLICSQEDTIQKFVNLIKDHFETQSLYVQRIFSGFIYSESK